VTKIVIFFFRRSLAYNSPFNFYYFKKNINKSANTFRDKTVDKTANNIIKIEEEAFVATAST